MTRNLFSNVFELMSIFNKFLYLAMNLLRVGTRIPSLLLLEGRSEHKSCREGHTLNWEKISGDISAWETHTHTQTVWGPE
jgi:hypothetical protein